MVALSPDELEALLKAAKQRSTRDWAMLVVTYRHALRCSEACGLKLGDINLKLQTIDIKRVKGSLHSLQTLCAHVGRPHLDELSALRQWLKQRPDDGSNALFVSAKGGAMHRATFFRIYRRYAQAVGLPSQKWHPHCLKHSAATHLIIAGVNLALVKQQLGRRSINSTMAYVGVNDSEACQAAQAALMQLF